MGELMLYKNRLPDGVQVTDDIKLWLVVLGPVRSGLARGELRVIHHLFRSLGQL